MLERTKTSSNGIAWWEKRDVTEGEGSLEGAYTEFLFGIEHASLVLNASSARPN